ncbi:hypothetical protein BH11ACT7_BH11ACT7_33560 [soil metagenome]
MVTSVTALVVAVALALCDRYTRRHPAWPLSARGRFYISCGYPMVAIAAYFLVGFSPDTNWGWAIGLAWGAGAVAAFLRGFTALNDVLHRHQAVSQSLESIPDPAEAHAQTYRR